MGLGRIATTTLVKRGDVRAKLILKTAEEAKRYGFSLVIVDGGSPEDFRQALRERGAEIFDENTRGMGMGRSRRQVLFEVSCRMAKDDAVIWMEPEKHPLVARLPAIAVRLMEEDIDLVTPGRKNLDTYPAEQKHEEMFLTLALQCLTGLKWDFGFGPFVAKQKALRYFLEYDGKYGDLWDSIWIPRLRIVAAGLRVEYMEVEYVHPAEQTMEETGNPEFVMKRLRQLNNMIPAFKEESQKLGLRK